MRILQEHVQRPRKYIPKNDEKNKWKSLPKKYVIGSVIAPVSFALIIRLYISLTKEKQRYTDQNP